MKKSYHKNKYRKTNLTNKNYDKDIQDMRDKFDSVSSIYDELNNNIITPDIPLSKLKQNFKCLLDEMNNLKEAIKKILEKRTQNSEIQNTNTNSYIKEKDSISLKVTPNIKIFQIPTKQLYQTYAIKLDIIKLKNTKIREDIKKYTLKLEDDEKNILKRNQYLGGVANLAVYANNFSYKLIELLKNEFYKNNKFKTVIYERAKEEFSSWVNQSLQIESSQKIIFFEKYCLQEFKSSSLINITRDNTLLQHYSILFTDLCELFTEILLFSEKDIELKFIAKGERYQQDEMNDITELRGTRYVNFTVLPGLSVNKKCFQFAKAIVFCEYEQNPKLQFNILPPKKVELSLNGTIKTKDIKDKMTIDCVVGKINSSYVFQIHTDPEIPNEDNPVFSLVYQNQSKWEYLKIGEKQAQFSLKREEIPKNTYIMALVKICGETKIYQIPYTTNQILNS